VPTSSNSSTRSTRGRTSIRWRAHCASSTASRSVRRRRSSGSSPARNHRSFRRSLALRRSCGFSLRKGLRNRVALTTAYAAGLRVGEVVRLKIGSIDSERMLLHIEGGKGGRDRYAMPSPRLLEILRAYWKRARPSSWLFPGQEPGGHVSRGALQSACRFARQRARIGKPVTAHSLRHSFATHLLESGTDIRIIQVVLGHTRLETTARYAQVATGLIAGTPSPFDRLVLEVIPPA
jgi:integrase/recombinase XerD